MLHFELKNCLKKLLLPDKIVTSTFLREQNFSCLHETLENIREYNVYSYGSKRQRLTRDKLLEAQIEGL